MNNQRQPNLQPLAALQVIAEVIDGQIKTLEDQCIALQQAHDQPGSMDDRTIEHVLRVFAETKQLMPVYDLQLEYWREKCSPSADQHQEIDRLAIQIKTTHSQIDLNDEFTTKINA